MATLVKVSPGWFVDQAHPDGPKVRKQEGDVVVESTNGSTPAETAVTLTDAGALLKGKVLEIKCQFVDAETKKKCGAKRTIKPQDAFQVRYCVTHQKEHRRNLRREKRRARAKAAA